MTSERKSFFEERTASEIKHLSPRQEYKSRGLVERILGLRQNEVIEVRFPITPPGFSSRGKSGARASRLNYKHGEFIALDQPRTLEKALETREIPLAIRKHSITKAMKNLREEEIDFVGYSWYPLQGRDCRKRVVPFVWLAEAVRIFAYAENREEPIITQIYDEAKRVSIEGASVVCRVPSRTKKHSRYHITLQHVPIDTEKRAVCWSLARKGDEPLHSEYNIRYTSKEDREGSNVLTFYPHDIAAYIEIVKKETAKHNLTPIEMSPFAFISVKMSTLYERLRNNVLIYD